MDIIRELDEIRNFSKFWLRSKIFDIFENIEFFEKNFQIRNFSKILSKIEIFRKFE